LTDLCTSCDNYKYLIAWDTDRGVKKEWQCKHGYDVEDCPLVAPEERLEDGKNELQVI